MLSNDPRLAKAEPIFSVLETSNEKAWVTPTGFALFEAEFTREGHDLLLVAPNGDALRLSDYFIADTPADILSDTGAQLAGRVVERLAGPLFPGQYAQAGGPDLAQAIGQVETLTGRAFVQRTDGTTAELDIGAKVFQGDVVRTDADGTLGLTFTDGTIFSLAAGSRMVLDELIYDPEGSDNKGVFDLVQGGFVFIAGQAASTGGIEINTPAATMGIRGTTVKVDIQTVNGISTVSVSLNPDPDGGIGMVELFDLTGNLIANIAQTDTKWIISPPFTNEPPIEIERTDTDFADDNALLSQAVAAFQSALNRVAQGETFVELPEGSGDGSGEDEDGTDGDEGDGGTDADPIVPPPLDETGDGGEAGESGTGNPELDGTDDPLLEGETGPDTDDDAFLEGQTPDTDTASNNNNAPQFALSSVQSTEDTPFTGNLGATDRNGNPVTVTLTQGAANGDVVLLDDGTFTFTPDPDFDGTDSFTVIATDAEGATNESEITVLVGAVNDAPVVQANLATGTTAETGLTSETAPLPASGTVGYSDVDEAGVPASWSIAAAPENTTALGEIAIDAATGSWTYVLDQGAADPLAQDQEVIETFIATVTDAQGATDTSTIAVSILGANDGPIILSEAASGLLAEDISGFATNTGAAEGEVFLAIEVEDEETQEAATGSVSGVFTFTDVDQQDTPGQWSVAADPGNTTDFGDLTIDALTGAWVYTLDQSAADVLGNDDRATEMFIATITDAFGATATQTITIDITGFNDAPTIEFSIEDIEATVFEEGFEPEDAPLGPLLAAARFASLDVADADASGVLRYTDPDGNPGEVATWSVAPDGPSFGTMTIDAASGAWHYFLDEDAAQVLGEGEERIETFTATVTDGLGQAATQVITITIVGSNDESEIIALPQDLEGAVAEGGVATATGTLTYVDPDAAPGEEALWSIAPDGFTRGDMTIDPQTGDWIYTLDPVRGVDVGQNLQAVETFTATLTDALGATSLQTITITIDGRNDAPQITGSVTTGTVVEAGAGTTGIVTSSGALAFDDPDDDGTVPVWQITADPANTTALGLMFIDGESGVWQYTLNDGAADSLRAGDSLSERFTATVTDAFGLSDSVAVTITILGTNDAPVFLNTTQSLTEDTAEFSVDLADLASDVDADENSGTLGYRLLDITGAGRAEIDGTDLIFHPDGAFDALNAGETATVTLRVEATDTEGATAQSTVTLTILGTNSAPVLADATRTLTEDTARIEISLSTLASDPDAAENGTTLTYEILTGPAQGFAEITNGVLGFETQGDFDDLAEGATRDVAITLLARDDGGATDEATVTLTITGRNGPPLIAEASDLTATVSEPLSPITPVSVFGQLIYADVDASTPSSGVWSILPATSALGQIGIDAASGVWTYTLNTFAADPLSAGDTRIEVFTATVTDEAGATDFREISIVILGTNDTPVLTPATRTLTEDEASRSFDLRALVSDIDSGDTPSNIQFQLIGAPAGTNADITDGVLTFRTDEGFGDLAIGETRDVVLLVQASDPQGGTAQAEMRVTVTGLNDGPVISAASVVSGDIAEPGSPSAVAHTVSGLLAYDDVDAPTATDGTWTMTPDSGMYGTIDIDAASGLWTYTLDQDTAETLNAGEVITETFTATITDAAGASDSQDVTITITGTNDAPVLAADSATVSENSGTTTFNLVALASDKDAADDPADLTFTISSDPVGGTATIADGVLEFATGSDFEDLAAGETADVSIGVQAADGNGGSVTTTFTVTVTGDNDAPVIRPDPESMGAVTEPGTPTATPVTTSGTLLYDDADAPTLTSGTWTITPDSSIFGSIDIDAASGLWTYTLDQDTAEMLNAGEVITETFTATITDAAGASDSQGVTITITGTNDAPVLMPNTRDLSEDDQVTVFDLAALASDADQGSVLSFRIVTEPDLGRAVLDETGTQLSFFTDGAFDDLPADETRDVTIEVEVRDQNDATGTALMTVTVGGSNDGPVITSTALDASGAVNEAGEGPGAAVSDGAPDAQGTLRYIDPDEGDGPLGTWTVETIDPTLGTLTIDAETGAWFYFLDQDLADSLREGALAQDAFTAVITDAEGATDLQVITITITGTNDRPQITSSNSVVESTHSEGDDPILTGQLNSIDPDDEEVPRSWTIAREEAAELTYGEMTIASDGTWTYTADQNAVETLGQGQRVVEEFRATVWDEFGQSDSTLISIEITGTNSSPVLIAQESTLSGEVREPGAAVAGALTATGTLAVFDPDDDATSGLWTLTAQAAGTLGSATIDPVSGNWTYVLDAAAANSLDQGDTRTEIFDAVYTDFFGAAIPAQAITITITGSNDAPTLEVASQTTDEDTSVLVDLSAFAADVDAGDVLADLTFDILAPPPTGMAEISGQTLSFDPVGAFDDLPEGQSRSVDIALRVSDPLGASSTATLTLTVTGKNDAPTITFAAGQASGTITEAGQDSQGSVITGGTSMASGLLVAADLDSTSSLTWTGDATGSWGIFTIDPATGAWTYAIDNAAADALNAGQMETETFTARVTDDKGAFAEQVVTIKVTGTNDAPTLDAQTTTPMAQEDGPVVTIDLAALGRDPDAENDGSTLEYEITGRTDLVFDGDTLVVDLTGQGALSIEDQTLRFDPQGDFQMLSEGMSVPFSVTIKATDDQGAYDEATYTIDLQGKNDAPVLIQAIDLGTISEDGGAVIQLDTFFSTAGRATDVDLEDSATTLTYSFDNFSDGNFTTSANSLSFIAAGAFDDLPQDETAIVTVDVTARDSHNALSNTAELSWTITGVNDAPVLANAVQTTTYDFDNSASGNFDVLAGASDAEGDNLSIGGFFADNGQVLLVINSISDPSDDTLSYIPDDGFVGTDVVTYTVTDGNGGKVEGKINVVVPENDLDISDATTAITLTAEIDTSTSPWVAYDGHFYQYVAAATSWTAASAGAANKGGYLATITSAGENNFLKGLAAGREGYLGGSDRDVEGVWRWVEGPDAGLQFWQGGINGQPISGTFQNFRNGTEPNSQGNEDYLHAFGDGAWNDIGNATRPQGYFVEYSGVPVITGSLLSNISNATGAVTFAALDSPDGFTLNADGSWDLDQTEPSFVALSEGEAQNLTINYTAQDSIGKTGTGVFTITLTGANDLLEVTPLDAGHAFGYQYPITIDLAEGANDPDVNDPVMISDLSASWTNGVSGPALALEGGQFITIDPGDLSAELGVGGDTTLTLTYDITSGGETLSNTATLDVFAYQRTFTPPVFDASAQSDALANAISNTFQIPGGLFADDLGGTGITYTMGLTTKSGALPAWLAFDTGSSTLSVTSGFTVGSTALLLTAYEGDNENTTVPFEISVSNNGQIEHAIYGPDEDFPVGLIINGGAATDAGRLEVGYTSGSGGNLVDLSGIDALSVQGLDKVGVIDLRNGSDDVLQIDAADILALIDGNGVNADEVIKIEVDAGDNWSFVQDGFTATASAGDPATTTDIKALASGGVFDGFGTDLAMIFIDDGSPVSS